ncbi:MAG TPA: Fe-S cluster assembly protein SufD [Stellaceae bacterium]|nr:Fe-S cluster assembly protein SufD [Stellaceae bacterium]
MSAMSAIKAETTPYLEAFRARKREGEPAWLSERRKAAAARFAELGFPTRRQELWRFTNLAPLLQGDFPPNTVENRIEIELAGKLPAGAWLGSVKEVLEERPDLLRAALDEAELAGAQPFVLLNAALFDDGFILAVEPGTTIEHPIEVTHWGEGGGSFHPRSIILLGKRSSATVIEKFEGRGKSWTNSVSMARLAANAHLQHVTVQGSGPEAIHLGLARAELAAGAHYDTFLLTLGARLSRADVIATIAGEGARCSLAGATLLRESQEATVATFVDHAAPGGETREVFKSVVDDRAHGVFLGKIAVRPGADKTDANQQSRNLLLSPRAAVDTKPELEILADDVKCSHGATVGDLDANAVFYLRSRGIDEAAARSMLIEAFAVDAIEGAVVAGPIRELLRRRVGAWLEQSGS